MEERNNVITIFKSNDPEKLVVFQAESLRNQIRFYLNDTQYLVAIESDQGCLIMLDEEVEKKGNEKSKIFSIKEHLKKFIKLFFVNMGILLLCLVGPLYLSKIINNTPVFFFSINIAFFIMDIVDVVILESNKTAPCIKSKHSAEHMMINFLEINKRLPKNIEEVKKCSRFSLKCGSKELIEGIEEFIWNTIVAFLATIMSEIVEFLFHNSISTLIVLLGTYLILSFVIKKLITKYGKLNFIISPIKKVLINIVQCANTTSKVKDRDIILAYSVAKPWVQLVYPEFYNREDDVFWKQYFKS